ncbi:alpha-glucan family phosphorylase [Tsukamurella paurometabola]|uniref:glycogen phosphorylase n=1 Tax=Tsukamurella paurometabola TaxID=2061 RepID=A0A3P8KCD4_TSUPA|nr:alpha-glucan family phosphorylase [Tsukamurella paurometabola]MBS4100815.1 alpha-glucan family phosphorylase [Tsukamurella paurometabola]UEA84670.1 alpha-glucan family phosphorylase [Tsukamurella paurometabola]VDR37248.1 maltodextrin phosphorylase [Tsukamurella paurometabola]
MHAEGTFTVEPAYPESLAPLADLARNLRWVWHGPTQDLFSTVAPEVWAATRDPLAALRGADQDRVAALGSDPEFAALVRALHADLNDYLTRPAWADELKDGAKGIAYFSMEFGVSQTLPNYSGGLGVLAGDHLKAASDLGLPLIALGLLYRHGYFQQSLSADGWQLEAYPELDPGQLPLRPVTLSGGQQLVVSVPLEGRVLSAAVWRADVGRIPLLLMDTDIENNDPDLRGVTDRLYGGDAEHRLRQEILLGIGGVRAARAFCDLTGHPGVEVFHANEGHAGFLGLERIRELMATEELTYAEAKTLARTATVFTTHTPVPAGIDRFPVDLVRRYFGDGGQMCSLLPTVPLDEVIALGAEADPGVFNMAHMGFRLAQRANGVSKLHGAVSREMFAGLWPGFEPAEVPIGSVTNGVHHGTWADRLVAERATDPLSMPDDALWRLRTVLRHRLVDEVRTRTRAAWRERGAVDAELGWTDRMFDPEVLTIGFARRVSTYKRLTLMLRDPERLRALLLDPDRPVQVVIAGKSHPHDDEGKRLLQQLLHFTDDRTLRHRIAFLPNYSIGMAGYLYHGCDVWLNNPLRPLEACGTSGMKSAMNGGLNLSVLDGWWDELYDGNNGWAIPSAVGVDPGRRDDIEADALYDLLEHDVVPAFYDRRDTDDAPPRWLAKVRHTLSSTAPEVSADRMVREYATQYYRPAARSARSTRPAIGELVEYIEKVRSGWDGVRVGETAAAVLPEGVEIAADIALGALEDGDVRVEAVIGGVDEAGEIVDGRAVRLHFDGERYRAVLPGQVGRFGYAVRVLPQHRLLTGPAELGLVRYAR